MLLLCGMLLLLNVIASAQRIVSLVPSVTQTLKQMGADDKVVARTSYCPKSESGETVVVGDVLSVNVEKIVSMRPTAVVTMGFTKPEVIEKLRKMKVNVVELTTPSTFEEMCGQTLKLGELAGCEESAEKIVEKARIRLEGKEKIESEGKKMFIEIGVRPLWGASPKTYQDEMIRKMGYVNVVDKGNGSISREALYAAKPDVVVVALSSEMAADEVRSWKSVKGVKVAVTNDDKMNCPTPLNYVDVLEDIMKQIGE